MLTVIISDKNSVFSSGLYIIFKEYFERSAMAVNIIEEEGLINQVKIFNSDCCISSPVFIDVRDSFRTYEKLDSIIYRSDSVNEISMKLDINLNRSVLDI